MCQLRKIVGVDWNRKKNICEFLLKNIDLVGQQNSISFRPKVLKLVEITLCLITEHKEVFILQPFLT